MDTRCRIEMLGGLKLLQGERVITRFRTYKTGVLLAYLAFYRQRAHPREELIDLLWPDCEPDAGRNSLSQSLSSLRNQLEPPGVPAGAILRADRANVQILPERVTTDVAEFEAALRAAQQAGVKASSLLAEAVDGYGGELLPGYYEDWNLRERTHLQEAYLQAVSRLVRLLEQAGEQERAIAYARRAVQADPLREEAQETLIRLYAESGQPEAARRQFQQMEQILAKELGSSPSPALRALVQLLPKEGPAQILPPRPPVQRRRPPTLPIGTVTVLSIEAQEVTAASQLLDNLRKQGGHVLQEENGRWEAAFGRASDALACAMAGLRLVKADGGNKNQIPPSPLVGEESEGCFPPVRMALHTGEIRNSPQTAEILLQQSDRLLRASPPGQILCSEETAILLRRDLDPGARLVDLGLYRLEGGDRAERLFAVASPGRPAELLPRPAAQPGYAGSLPLQLTRFFGRENELAALQQMLRPDTHGSGAGRLITLTGPGGTGKTRLAIEAARALLEPFAGAVWFVPLAELTDPRRILDAVIQALHLSPSPQSEPIQQVVEALSPQPTLLVLDNFEQLLADTQAARQEGLRSLRLLLERVPSLVCLVTSRQRLGLLGEREFPVAPLPVPQERDNPERLSLNESVQLFSDRAQAVKPDFQVTRGNASAVAALCERLEGIPLALELAAGRAQVLTPGQMLRQLERRFDFLVSRQRDAVLRHQTLRAAIDWSYQMLSPQLQRFFASLSVFRGGWNLDALEQIRQAFLSEEEDALDLLSQLRECSLVEVQENPDEMRFYMLETLREYAEEKLSLEESIVLKRSHAHYFLALAEEADTELGGPQQGVWLSRLETEHNNLRMVIHWCLQDAERTEASLRLAGALWGFWHTRGYFREGQEHLHAILSQETVCQNPPARAKALRGAGVLAANQGDYAAARTLVEQSLAISRELADRHGIAAALNNLGTVAGDQGDYSRARSLYEEGLAISRELGDKLATAVSLEAIAELAARQGQNERAVRIWAAAEVLREVLGSPLPPKYKDALDSNVAMARTFLGEEAFAAAWSQGRAMSWDQAVAYALQDNYD